MGEASSQGESADSRQRHYSAGQVVAAERAVVGGEFAAFFDSQYPDYLETDYRRYVDVEYPRYVAEQYDFIDPAGYPSPERPDFGLAISGGGIRSASFAIGVIQALNNPGLFGAKPSLFAKLRYQSSVSGGGYTGAALSWYQRRFGLFPFGNLDTFSGSQNSRDRENQILSYLRQHGKYLTPHELGFASLIATVFSSVVHSLLAYTLLFAVVFLGVVVFADFGPVARLLELPWLGEVFGYFHTLLLALLGGAGEAVDQSDGMALVLALRAHVVLLFIALAIFSLVGYFLLLLVYAFSSQFRKFFTRHYAYRIRVQFWYGRALLLAVASLFLATIPVIAHHLIGMRIGVEDHFLLGASTGSGLLSAIMSFNQLRRSASGKPDSGVVNAAFTALVSLLLILLLLVTSYALGEILYRHGSSLSLLLFFLVTLVICVTVNVNQISPHKLYRDRLMETFLKDPEVPPDAPLARIGGMANEVLLTDLRDTPHWSPYHLVNCNIILDNAFHPKYRGRLGDSFLLSSRFCGSDATRYVTTDQFIDGQMTLATAMAISGAATNPNAGVAGLGASTTSPVAFLMTFLGLRLGFWVLNPTSWMGGMSAVMRPNYLWPGLPSLLNVFVHSERSAMLELSDGGHFDNSGLYELVRRRLAVIILADGSADPDAKFEDFGNALERIRVDFGVTVRFRDERLDLTAMQPGSSRGEAGQTAFDQRFNLAERGFAIGDIVYPDLPDTPGFVGKLVYIKAVLTRGLPEDLYAYKCAHADFPNHPTVDQFFDERQFESYRELGYQLARQCVSSPTAMAHLP
ncbi:hypothetical protein [Haliea sp. E17]|uniref:hypothetical protein n=1 Tax=Haliea sp. E17 TaxID=3401576 RepID=UPI003AAAAA99